MPPLMTWRVVSSPPMRMSSDSLRISSVVEAVAVDLGVDEHAHQVVGRVGAPLPRPPACTKLGVARDGVHRAAAISVLVVRSERRAPCRRTSAAGRRGPRRRRRACRRSWIIGSGAAMSRTKSHSPRSHTASMIASTTCADLRLAARAPAPGVKPRLTSLRRFQCSGSSMSIIIGIGPVVGPDAARVGEQRRAWLDTCDEVVAWRRPTRRAALVAVDRRVARGASAAPRAGCGPRTRRRRGRWCLPWIPARDLQRSDRL